CARVVGGSAGYFDYW
nr:immunoglobulin heavy chain junction region [Macaca mulatta]MOX61392.1 immunoglobulin heavy chain junction region [Macaca mulatta]MOX62341.1 immunoglobulin heavy chain junction region [Macaca mulatta]MOX62349.1 immunoglobulin heavy chain junction region [Macaca mulatta]MOX62571.1 immunoglobulin heavy chain junction region [Macaca mulatta]